MSHPCAAGVTAITESPNVVNVLNQSRQNSFVWVAERNVIPVVKMTAAKRNAALAVAEAVDIVLVSAFAP